MQRIINTAVCYYGLHPAPTLCKYVLNVFAINKQNYNCMIKIMSWIKILIILNENIDKLIFLNIYLAV